MPIIIIIILVIVFFVPLLNAAIVAFVAAGGLLMLLLKALPYIIGAILIIWLVSYIIAKTADKNEAKKLKTNNSPVAARQPSQTENHQVKLSELESLINYYRKFGSYKNHPIYKTLTTEQKKSMDSLMTQLSHLRKTRIPIWL
ncbi:hypothetical protein HQN89_35545 [Paenibacillus frigoriresistens]|uniref:hypothetical protein n=1 Tax=Paenibacillus alginolyticus TaxID=59839 RepID=UPI00156697C3|nr:hypothetical protein [Paenibacillus frigoriresistens]NRF96113.1 hypothetical protein [Paenibacillus frigoriresistens]